MRARTACSTAVADGTERTNSRTRRMLTASRSESVRHVLRPRMSWCCGPRSSVRRQGAGRGLLGWFLRQESPVDGWTDYLWNGITTLAWAELAARTVEGSGLGPGIHQPTTAHEVTKDELLRMFGELFEHRVDIRPVRTEQACNHTLLPTTEMPPLRRQLIALRAWMSS